MNEQNEAARVSLSCRSRELGIEKKASAVRSEIAVLRSRQAALEADLCRLEEERVAVRQDEVAAFLSAAEAAG